MRLFDNSFKIFQDHCQRHLAASAFLQISCETWLKDDFLGLPTRHSDIFANLPLAFEGGWAFSPLHWITLEPMAVLWVAGKPLTACWLPDGKVPHVKVPDGKTLSCLLTLMTYHICEQYPKSPTTHLIRPSATYPSLLLSSSPPLPSLLLLLSSSPPPPPPPPVLLLFPCSSSTSSSSSRRTAPPSANIETGPIQG